MTGAPQLTHSTRGSAPPSVLQLLSTTVCYVFDNYCNLLLQFAVLKNNLLIESPGMVIVYMIGAWLGIHYYEQITIRRSKKQAMIGLMIFGACCVIQGMEHLLPQWATNIQIPLIVTIISCGAFWISFDFLNMKKCPKFMSDSFLIYAMHSLIGAALSKIVRMILPLGELFTLLTAVITFTLTIVLICVFGKFLSQYAPRVKRILVGR